MVKAHDGRDLQVLEAGDLDGFPVFVHHGTPACRLLYKGTIDDARSRGIRLISHDRPGYGGSTRRPGRIIGDVADDVAAIADHLGLDHFASWGISGGGPHVLACAALLPDRCVAAAALASIAPYDAEGLDFFAGMGEDNIEEFKLSLDGEEAIRPGAEEHRRQMMSSAEDLIESIRTLLTPTDEAVFRGETADYLVRWMTCGMKAGVDGWLDDDLAFVWSWGFDLKEIDIPVQVWQGRQDKFVPFGHGEWIARQVPTAEPHLTDVDGHMTLLTNRIPEVHAWLLRHP